MPKDLDWLEKSAKVLNKDLEKHRVEVVEHFPDLTLSCNNCNAIWMPKFREDGRLESSSWKCPNACSCGE